jgi:hypothetical protein
MKCVHVAIKTKAFRCVATYNELFVMIHDRHKVKKLVSSVMVISITQSKVESFTPRRTYIKIINLL